jgi:pyruvate,water dikinase
MNERISTGFSGFDKVIDYLRLGDNVVWQVDSVSEYKEVIAPYVKKAIEEKRKIVYIRFAEHESLLEEDKDIEVVEINPNTGFENFLKEVHFHLEREGKKVFYVFDCLSELLKYWFSDLMVGNFFKVTCPYLYELDTIAYFAIIRNSHTYSTIAGIRETTQLLLDLHKVDDNLYIHPLKVWQRYSPEMFFPHLIQEDKAVSVTASTEAAQLFSRIRRAENRPDYWNVMLAQGDKNTLMKMLIGHESRMYNLCDKYFTLEDILFTASREVGTGFIGGKSVGMLLARKILEKETPESVYPFLEPHDSFYIGSDIFYTYLVENGWWKLRRKQKSHEGYYKYAEILREKFLHGKFPQEIKEQFMQMLEYFGQSPIIVRSSSLLEDNFGNAFAGKYESVFCVNQGTPEERYEAFENAVRQVYSSVMSEEALRYRMNRGLLDKDEQMALLVQRVSGDCHDDDFFPHIAGVGNSSNLYVWDDSIDMESGMLRMVLGLGTRAVDRTEGDYVKIISLDQPLKTPFKNKNEEKRFSQHQVDVLSLKENELLNRKAEDILSRNIKTDKNIFASLDISRINRLNEEGYDNKSTTMTINFKKLLKDTTFPDLMKEILKTLSNIYDYPVDIEFTGNFNKDGDFKINLLQCRPLQTKGLGKSVEIPEITNPKDCLFASKGNFMGGNIRLPIDYVLFVREQEYLNLKDQEKYSLAREIGEINDELKGKNLLFIAPGRWGSTTPSLGVPVHFTEIANASVICEVSSQKSGFMPELSYGSHFFQDLVESEIFYAAIFDGQKDVIFNPEYILNKKNLRESKIIHLASTSGMEIFSDIKTQQLLCR